MDPADLYHRVKDNYINLNNNCKYGSVCFVIIRKMVCVKRKKIDGNFIVTIIHNIKGKFTSNKLT